MNTDLKLRRASSCTFAEMRDVWNAGFQGYFVDMTLSLDALMSRITAEGISLDFSFIAFSKNAPVGFLLNGIRRQGGHRVAWNGGTGVVPPFRGKGVGKLLVNAALSLYASEDVSLATLEAITDNAPAIALYQKCGYEIADELIFLQRDTAMPSLPVSARYQVEFVPPAMVGVLNFYRKSAPWQGQWQSIMLGNGDGLIAYDEAKKPVAYALRKKRFDDNGKLAGISLYQCEVNPECDDRELAAGSILDVAFSTDEGPCLRRAHNFSKSNSMILSLLDQAGFELLISQVQMMKRVS